MLLAYRLVKLIERHSDGLSRNLVHRYRNCQKCSAYANVPETELTAKGVRGLSPPRRVADGQDRGRS